MKFGLFDDSAEREIAAGAIEAGPEPGAHRVAATEALRAVEVHTAKSPIRAVGHRVVHGGTAFRDSVAIDANVLEALERLSDLAPLHNPPSLAVIGSARHALPQAVQVAAFDTAFYADLPLRAQVYPVPFEWYTQWGIRRFGFHGLNHSYCAQRAREMVGGRARPLRIVSCHLGSGCSATAVDGETPVATTMGFTPLEGLMMGSRSGSIDPGILLYLAARGKLSVTEMDDVLNHRSGLHGVSGISSDFREVQNAARAGAPRAELALDIYCDRIRAAVGALAVTLSGLDALVFTGGVGEHSGYLRERVCQGLECLGVRLDISRNAVPSSGADADVASTDSAARVLVVRAREEWMVAREVRRIALPGVP